MTNFKKQLFSVITAGALVVNAAGTAFAGTTIQISGNGAGSDNFVTANQSSTTVVNQTNNANVTNNVSSTASTGGNDANFNTGGNVTVQTGNATTTTNVSNALNSNTAQVNCCQTGGTDVLVSGNGAFSDNTVNLGLNNTTVLTQDNTANVSNYIDSSAKTGHNDAGLNTGGDVVVKTGNATTNTTVSTVANSNAAVIGNGMSGATVTPTASFRILGNGAGSDNFIDAGLSNTTVLGQSNDADITNDVDADASTGGNDAKFNTGGDVIVLTGNAKSDAAVDNMVNFNAASVDCGCDFGVLAKIDGNGANFGGGGLESLLNLGDNVINLDLTTTRVLGQDNGAYLDNNLDDVDAHTGYNDASLNTGSVDTYNDPAVVTGNATTSTSVSNSGNSNVLGGTLPLNWPFGNTNVGVNFNWSAVMAFFGLHM